MYFGSHKEKATYVLEQEEEGSRKVEVQAKFSGIEYKRGPELVILYFEREDLFLPYEQVLSSLELGC